MESAFSPAALHLLVEEKSPNMKVREVLHEHEGEALVCTVSSWMQRGDDVSHRRVTGESELAHVTTVTLPGSALLPVTDATATLM